MRSVGVERAVVKEGLDFLSGSDCSRLPLDKALALTFELRVWKTDERWSDMDGKIERQSKDSPTASFDGSKAELKCEKASEYESAHPRALDW